MFGFIHPVINWMIVRFKSKDHDGVRTIAQAIGKSFNRIYQSCIGLYWESAADPDKPRKDGEGNIKGQAIDFLEVCLSPLDVPYSRSAIYGMYRRLTQSKPKIDTP